MPRPLHSKDQASPTREQQSPPRSGWACAPRGARDSPTPWLTGLWTPGAHLRLVTLSSDHFPAEGSVPGRPRHSPGQRPEEAWMGGRSVSAQLPARPGPAGPEDQAGPRDTQSTSDRENWPTGPEQVRKLASFQGHSDPPQPRPGGIRVSWAGDWASRTRSAPHGRRAERGAACGALRGERSWAPETTCRRGRTVWKSLRTGRRAAGCPRSGGPGSADRKRGGAAKAARRARPWSPRTPHTP